MLKIFFVLSCLTVVPYQIATAQCVNRQSPCNLINEAIGETPRNIITQPIATTFTSQNTIVETPCNVCNSVHQIPITNLFPAPTTIITDYSPAVCKNLADALQLMVVCNLLQNTKGTSDLALRLSSPILNEVLSSSFSCGCANPLYWNTIPPNLISSPVFSPNVIPSSGYISAVPSNPIGNTGNNGLYTNILKFIE
ncbi:unnamed protein product [Parnassius mnemosyne]|uniref:Secreted protein n=1 Tax=Parnassius mnemosyne TaxID=213953 RepID=A0AAV1LHC9_9NEOP